MAAPADPRTVPDPRTILVPGTILVYVGLDLMGDGLIKLPFLRALRRAYPGARITWLAGKGRSAFAGRLAPLAKGLIDEVVEDAGIGLRPVELLGRPLAGRAFDLIIDTQRRLLTTLILRRIPHRRFVSASAGWWLSDAKGPKDKPARMLDQLLQVLAVARWGRADGPLDSSGAAVLPEKAVEAARAALPAGRRYVALAPGAGGRHKCWPLASYIDLARALAEAGYVPFFVLGPEEGEWRAEIEAALPGIDFPLDRMPLDLDPLSSMALAARASVCVANDAGGGHIFAASGAPLVSLFGPTPPAKFAPEASRLSIVRAQNFGGEAMADIPVAAVLQAVERIARDPAA